MILCGLGTRKNPLDLPESITYTASIAQQYQRIAALDDCIPRKQPAMPLPDNWPDAAQVEELKQKGDIKGLIRLLLQKNDHMSILAVRALAELRHPLAVEPLCTALHERSAIVRMTVVEALGQIGDTRVLDVLRDA